jgi:hypothetical protein
MCRSDTCSKCLINHFMFMKGFWSRWSCYELVVMVNFQMLMIYLFSKFGILNETTVLCFFYTHELDHYGIIDKVNVFGKVSEITWIEVVIWNKSALTDFELAQIHLLNHLACSVSMFTLILTISCIFWQLLIRA